MLGLKIENFTPQNIKSDTKEAACLNLISFIISLRITIEMRGAKIQPRKISNNEANADWASIVAYRSKEKDISRLNMQIHIGKKAADFFTLDERDKASAVSAKRKSDSPLPSPYESIFGDKPYHLASNIRRLVKEKYKIALNKSVLSVGLQNSDIVITTPLILHHIKRDTQVGQFPPVLEHDIIHSLEVGYGFRFPTLQDGSPDGAALDPCAGYGGREIGALSHPDIMTYVGVDPNPALTDSYYHMRDAYAPHKQVFIFPKKIEDVTREELQLGINKKYQLILTSPPYGVEHYYKGQTYYGDQSNLKGLFAGILKTADVLDDGGFMVINFGIVGPVKSPTRHLPNLFHTFIKEHPTFTSAQLKLFAPVALASKSKGHTGAVVAKEYLIYARHEANMGAIPKPLPAPVFSVMEIATSLKRLDTLISESEKLRIGTDFPEVAVDSDHGSVRQITSSKKRIRVDKDLDELANQFRKRQKATHFQSPFLTSQERPTPTGLLPVPSSDADTPASEIHHRM